MDFDLSDKSVEARLGTLEQILGQLLADQMAANGNGGGGGAAGMNIPVMPIIGGSGGSGPFQLEDGKVGAGGFYLKREFHSVDETVIGDISNFSGYIYLSVYMPDATGSVSTGQQIPQKTDTWSYYPLYKIENGAVAVDLRGCPHVPYYE